MKALKRAFLFGEMMHKNFMKRAIELAKLGGSNVFPNPQVGAVIVKDNQIIAEGYHQVFGGDHAEVNAFNQATSDVSGAEMYVTLEPCSHYGKTPPCALKIIEKESKRFMLQQKIQIHSSLEKGYNY